jgi:hypothetical protein
MIALLAAVVLPLLTSTDVRAAAAEGPKNVRDCAARLLAPAANRSGVDLTSEEARAQWMHTRHVPAALPVDVYSAELVTRRPGVSVTFVADSACTLIGGDLNEVLGLSLAPDEAVNFAITQYNLVVAATGAGRDGAGLPHVQVLLQLALPHASIRVLNSVDDIPLPAGRASRQNSRALGKFRKQISAAITEPGAGGLRTLRFYTWSAAGGVISSNTAVLLADGRISLTRTTLAARTGAYLDVVSRM